MWDRFRENPPAKYYCSLTGGINASKTYYLITLINALLNPDSDTETLFRRYGIEEIEIIDPVSWNLYKDLLYQCKMLHLEFTDQFRPLGFFNLIMRFENKVYEIVLFNSSGEKIEDEYLLRKFKTDSHEMKGAATLCFVDPREDTKLNKILEFPKIDTCTNYEFANHVYKVMQVVNGRVKIVNNPLAVCISKFDLLLHRVPYQVPEHPFVEAHSRDFFGDIQSTSEKLKTFLHDCSQTVRPEDLEKKFSCLNYFAIAPFGSDMKPADWDKRSPKGILAPFFWVLKERKIINDGNGTY
jgi:hypothetical protein